MNNTITRMIHILFCYSFDVINGAPNCAKDYFLSPVGSFCSSCFFSGALVLSVQPTKNNSSKPQK
jgi:hypothetical protein